MDTKEYIKQLEKLIIKYNEAYRRGEPLVPDARYDEMVAELRLLDPDNDWFKHIEPAVVGKNRKTKLPIPMKSLNKAKNMDEVKQWAKSLALPVHTKLVLMPKYDGVSWLHDELNHKTYSRGGAENEGQDCSDHFKEGGFAEVRNKNAFPASFTFGELVFSRQKWESSMSGRVSDYTGEPYRSPRNTVAGFINRDNAPEDIGLATFVRYGVDGNSLGNWQSFSDLLKDISGEFEQYAYTEGNKEELFYETTLEQLSEHLCDDLFFLWKQSYYIDGIVIYIDDLALWDMIGRKQTTGNPMYAIAYKHPDFTESFDTVVKDISWKVSKSGALKPVVNIHAVDTGDCVMESPTGYNAKYIFENGIGPGARIVVTRSGGVVPKIIKVDEEAESKTMLALRNDLMYCPSCGEPTKWNGTKVELTCTNPECPGIRVAKIIHFYSVLEAEQIGEDTVCKMFQAGYDTLKRILDITFDELMMIEGFGECVSNNILSANHKIRAGVEITKLMHASDCFDGIGQVKAKSIISQLSDSDRLALTHGYVFFKDDFEKSPQFLAMGKTLQSFYKGITPFYEFVAKNGLRILPATQTKPATGNKCAGMKVCFSGIRNTKLEEEIVLQGGSVVSGVSKNTTHLIVANKESTSSKIRRAKSLHIPILTVDEFKSI